MRNNGYGETRELTPAMIRYIEQCKIAASDKMKLFMILLAVKDIERFRTERSPLAMLSKDLFRRLFEFLPLKLK